MELTIPVLQRPFRGIAPIVGISLGIGLVMALVEIPMWPATPWLALANICTTVSLAAVGLTLRRDQAQRGTGWILILAGVVHPLGWWGMWNFGPFPLYATVFGELDDILGTWALLRYPAARLTPYHRLYVWMLGAWLIGGRFFLATVSRPSDYPGVSSAAWWPTIYADHRVFTVGMSILDDGIMCLIAVALILYVMRLRSAGRVPRHVRVPIATTGIVAALAAATATILAILHLALPPFFSVEAAGAAIMIPLTVAWIGWWASEPVRNILWELPRLASVQEMEELLRCELDTSSLCIFYWDVEQRCYADVSGCRAELPGSSDHCLVKEIPSRENDRPIAYVAVDSDTERRHPQLLDLALLTLGLVLGKAQFEIYLDDRKYWEEKLALLDEREGSVLRLIAEEGMTNPQISQELYISVKLVELTANRIFRKLGVKSRGQAALIWDRAHHVPQRRKMLTPGGPSQTTKDQ